MTLRPPRLRTLLLLSNLVVLALPITGLWAMRLYESALVRQTESELIAQAAVLAATFHQELRRSGSELAPPPVRMDPTNSGLSVTAVSLLRRPGLDLADDPILPPPPEPVPALKPAEARAAAVGLALAPIVLDAQAVTLAAIRLTDANGVVVASSGSDLGLSLANWQEVSSVLSGAPLASTMRQRDPVQAGLSSLSRTSGLRVFVALPVVGGSGIAGTVVLSRTPRTALQAVWGKGWELSGFAIALVFAGALFAVGLSRLVTRPLASVVDQARRVALGGDIVPVRHPGTREVAELSGALSQMATMLDERARYITAFAASVSHEFKTPLAALRGAAELLEDHGDTLPVPEKARLLGVVSGSTQRLDQLVGRLLDLARADMMRPGAAAATAIASVLDEILPRYRVKGLTTDADVGDTKVALSADALTLILTSLLDNAETYAGGDSRDPHVTIRASTDGKVVRLIVADDGPGISPANRGRIFDPFFTTGRPHGGTGLGLSIVRAIAGGAGGKATLAETAQGAQFEVELPATRGQISPP